MMLRACPFCGGTPKAYFFADAVVIECTNKKCEARVSATDGGDHPSAEQSAMRKWNRRP